MEKIFTNKSIWKKIVVAILIVMAFQVFGSAPIVRATTDDAAQEGDNLLWAGILMRPVLSLLLTIGDGITNLLHNVVMGQQQTLIPVNNEMDWLAILIGVIVGIVVFAAVIAASIATLGILDVILASTAISVGTIGMGTVILAGTAGVVAGTAMYSASMPDTLQLPLYSYSAEEIFENNILLFDVDFFNPTSEEDIYVCYDEGDTVNVDTNEQGRAEKITTKEGEKGVKKPLSECKTDIEKGKIQVQYYFFYKNGEEVKTSPQNSARELRNVISRWYVGIRNICIVIMLSVLIYIGIRMMLTSVANDKAKYKEMLKDWIIGLCLLFIIHYIMAFSVVIVEKITEVVKAGVDNNAVMVKLGDVYDGKLVETAEDLGFTEKDGYIVDGKIKDSDGNEKDGKILAYPTNLMGKIRLQMQEKDDMQTGRYIGLVICFLMLVMFTVVFTCTYLKRLLHMAFLTIIAPLVAMTYCIDKVNDGQAQGFNIWLKEYAFNLLIQPMHLILYYILVTAAFELSGTNVIYSLVAIGFMIPAEKLLRTMFGFEKAKTPPFLGGPVGTSLVMQGLNRLSGAAGKGARGGKGEAGAKALNSNKDDDSGNIIRPISTFDKLVEGSLNNDESNNTLNTGRSRDDIQGDLNALDELEENDMVDEDSMNYLIDERERLNGEMSGIGASGVPQTENNNIRTVEDIQADLDALDELEANDLVDDNSMDYAIAERERLENEMAALNTQNTQQIRQQEISEDEENQEQQRQGRPTIRGAIAQRGRATGMATRRTLSATGAAAKVSLKNKWRNLPKTTFKAAKGLAVGGLVGGTALGIGAAAGIASGDPSKAATAMGTAVGAGYSFGRRGANSSATSHISSETRAAFDEVYHGEQYKEQDVEKTSKETRKNQINRLKAEQALNTSDNPNAAKKFLEDNGHYDQMIQSGITDIDRALVLEKGINEGVYTGVDDAIAHSQLYDNFGRKDPEKMSAKDKSNFNKTVYNGLTDRGIDDQTATRRTDEIRNKVSYLHQGLNN